MFIWRSMRLRNRKHRNVVKYFSDSGPAAAWTAFGKHFVLRSHVDLRSVEQLLGQHHSNPKSGAAWRHTKMGVCGTNFQVITVSIHAGQRVSALSDLGGL